MNIYRHKISIIVPCYKVEKYITNCIESILHQTYTNWELLLIDDGSPDNSGKICDKYAKSDNRIKVIHKENGGVACARNIAIDLSSGDYLSFLDGDDFLHPLYIEIMLGLCKKNNADISQCDFTRGVNIVFPEYKGISTITCYDNQSVFISEAVKIIVCGKLYKTEIVKKTKMPIDRFFEDDFTTWKWYYNAKKIVVTSQPLYYYTYNNESTMAQHKRKPNLSFIDAYDERIEFFKGTSEKHLEDCSHLQLCKALFLAYSSPLLSKEQKDVVLPRFKLSYKVLRQSQVICAKYKVLFGAFLICPTIVSRIIAKTK